MEFWGMDGIFWSLGEHIYLAFRQIFTYLHGQEKAL